MDTAPEKALSHTVGVSTMRCGQIDFPDELLHAIRDGRFVVFAGAGVSMGDPANLPSFGA